MKPLKLVISGIGPYGGRLPEIDFESFELSRPILIAGETGAGKTMIFDAICFALFDVVSGRYRGTDNLRSAYASPDTESYVDFSFSHQGKNYRIYRQPSYMRPLKRGSGFRLAKEKAVLYPGEDAPIEGIKAVNQAVRELLHVDEKQFKQLAMIAQGEFWGLLNAKTEERTGILRHIFLTGGYKAMEIQLRERKGAAARAAEALEGSISQYFNEAEAAPDSPLAEEISQFKAGLEGGVYSVEEMLRLLDRAVAADEPLQAALAERLAALQQAWQELQRDLALAENSEHNLKRYTGLQKELAELAGKLAEGEKQAKTLAEKAKALGEKIRALQAAQEGLREAPEKLAVCRQEAARLQEKQAGLAALLTRQVPQYERAGEKLAKMQAELLAAQEGYAAAAGARSQGEMQLERSRAGILAQGLQEGSPCPVCGSLVHPAPAELPEGNITEAKVKGLQQAEKKAEKQRTAAAAAAAAARAEFATLAEQLRRSMLACIGEDTDLCVGEDNASCIGEDADTYINECNDEHGGKCTGGAAGEEGTGQPDREIKELYQRVCQRQAQLGRLLQEKEGAAAAMQAQVKKLRQTEKELAAASGREREALEEEKQRQSQRLAEIKAAIADREGRLQLLGQMAGKGGSSGEELAEYRRQLQEKLQANKELQQACRQQESRICRRRENNLSRRERIAAQQENFAKARHEAGIAARLYNLVSGQTGKGKLTLEQYVQAAGFDSIIRAANRRLGPMSDGRYELHRQERELGGRSHTYLDLEVLDHYTGRRRPVRSLSGGESFQASLCLALGLSDKVSSELGGICMDALFIDEGFGTLDKKSIERAMEILLKLSDSNKLVAIISHREELKEAVSQQIQVMRTPGGSSLKIETGK